METATRTVVGAGYFARQVEIRPPSLNAPGVREICSVSECISRGAPNWIEPWKHNGFGFFNFIADALSVIPAGAESSYRLFAYRLHPGVYRQDGRAPLVVPADVRPEPIPADFSVIGFDAASRSLAAGLSFECSPLSCNSMAAELAANQFCLFPDLESALLGAERFAKEQPEPGDYYVLEVLERRR